MVNIQVIDPPLTPPVEGGEFKMCSPVEGGEFKMCPPVVGREKELMNS